MDIQYTAVSVVCHCEAQHNILCECVRVSRCMFVGAYLLWVCAFVSVRVFVYVRFCERFCVCVFMSVVIRGTRVSMHAHRGL